MQSLQQKLKDTLLPERVQPAWIWLRQNLFNSWFNTLLTLICLWAITVGGFGLVRWVFTQAQWEVVTANLRLIFVGRYPVAQLWRLWLAALLVAGVLSFSWGALQGWTRKVLLRVGCAGLGVGVALMFVDWMSALWCGAIALLIMGAGSAGAWCQRKPLWQSFKSWLPLLWLITFLVALWLMNGGFGLTTVSTKVWNGLLLTVFVAVLSIVLSFPLGVLLAIGRQSPLPIVRGVSIAYIELIRGLPLIGILFVAQVMLPLLLPPQANMDQLVRAIAGLTAFSAAYLAETVRGGLQSLPKGQWEASKALGLSTPMTLGFIVLPQALRAVVPAIVGQFIGLFKDTALLSIVGLVELTGIARSIAAQPDYLGRYAEVYLAIGIIYWLFCYGMSVASRRLEHSSGH
ncbi:MAG: amino acid ABC transporter permease [Acaryochloridaceae cyanobacterium RU_4_10]|nr:amino acid ABC transporter permease [Acaryochloridaceae cyanobacterium RU_4_10]